MPVMSSAAAARGRKAFCAAAFLGGAPSKSSAKLGSSHRTVLKSRSRSRYLQLVSCADRIGPSQVVICSARDEGQARMRKSPCEGCFVLHQSAHSICDGHRTPSSDPPRPIQCSASDGSKILCEDPALFFELSIVQIHLFEYEMSRGLRGLKLLKNVVMSQDLTPIQDFCPFSQC